MNKNILGAGAITGGSAFKGLVANEAWDKYQAQADLKQTPELVRATGLVNTTIDRLESTITKLEQALVRVLRNVPCQTGDCGKEVAETFYSPAAAEIRDQSYVLDGFNDRLRSLMDRLEC